MLKLLPLFDKYVVKTFQKSIKNRRNTIDKLFFQLYIASFLELFKMFRDMPFQGGYHLGSHFRQLLVLCF